MIKKILTLGIALALCGCATTSRDWQDANRRGTTEAYEKFLQNHPDANQAGEAQRRLQELQIDSEWGKTMSANTTVAYKEFQSKYPQSRYSAEAKELELEVDWKQAKSIDTIASYSEFIRKYPAAAQTAAAKQECERLEGKIDARTRSEYEAAGKDAALKWLALVDEGKGDETWELASANTKSYFKNKDEWVNYVKSTREGSSEYAMRMHGVAEIAEPVNIRGFGNLTSRKVRSCQYSIRLPGSRQDADYVTVVCDTVFEGPSAEERVVVVRDSTGKWLNERYGLKVMWGGKKK